MKPLIAAILLSLIAPVLAEATNTWDGKYDTGQIEVTVVYFVPSDRQPLPDWNDRLRYYCDRLELFHEREFQGQSKLTCRIHPAPVVSKLDTARLRRGDANAIYYRTLAEADQRIKFAPEGASADGSFPILLVMSDINWRPLDDFYRLRPGDDNALQFEGNYRGGQHFPGAASGGARASYIAGRGVGWGLVSADGWRVPYRGSDCVIYHEGCGHTVGLPHPEPGNGSVMSLGQYRGWLNESWLDDAQKRRLGWTPKATAISPPIELFSKFTAIPEPPVPKPGQTVRLKLTWPDGAQVKTLRVRYQTALESPWTDVAIAEDLSEAAKADAAPAEVALGTFDRPTPLSYRVEVELMGGASTELWGYLQVRAKPDQLPMPLMRSQDLAFANRASSAMGIPYDFEANPPRETDLLRAIDVEKMWRNGDWKKVDGQLLSPKQYGARIELPIDVPPAYRVTLIGEPLDKPNGLVFGHVMEGKRFLSLLNYQAGQPPKSALENIEGRNVGNESTLTAKLFEKNRPFQAIMTVRPGRVDVSVDGRRVIAWQGESEQLSLGSYWSTPNTRALFLGSYDCRYRFDRITIEPLSTRVAQ